MGVAIHWETADYILSHLLYLNVDPMFFMGLSVFEVRLDESQFSPCLMMNGALHQDSSLMENNIWLNTDLLVVHLLHSVKGALCTGSHRPCASKGRLSSAPALHPFQAATASSNFLGDLFKG